MECEWDLLVTLMAPPHASDTFTTVLRLLEATLARGARVQVWTCGYATLLTQRSLGTTKPRNIVAWEREHRSAAALVRDLLAANDGRLAWHACRFCSEERGASAHIPEVKLRAPFRFAGHVAESRKTVLIGGI